MKRTIIQLPEEMFEAVRRVAFEGNRSIADVVREAVEKHLREIGAMPVTGEGGRCDEA